MGRKVNIGLTPDYYKDERFVVPGEGLTLLEEMKGVEYRMLAPSSNLSNRNFDTRVITPKQIENIDMAASIAPCWEASSFVGNDGFLSVHRHGAGFDMVNVKELTDSNVILCTTPQAVTRPMAVVNLTYLLLLSTRYSEKNLAAKENRWGDLPKYPGHGLVGKILGFVGAGRIGRETMALAKPLDMKYIAYDPCLKAGDLDEYGAEITDLDTVLEQSDYVMVACPLNKHTYHLLGEKEFAKMKPAAFFINTARGPIADEAALISALQNGGIAGAGIDVFEQEPPSSENPLFHMNNVVVTPHALGWTDQAVMGIWSQIVGQMSCIMRGERPDGMINPEVWDKPEFQAKLKRFLDETKQQ